MKVWLIVILLCAAAATAGGLVWHNSAKSHFSYRTAPVERGDIASTITATGTLEPEEVIDVGAQVAGLIQAFGIDSNGNQIDYRSPVEANMVLAKIDDAVYRADVDTAKAQLEQSNANVKRGEADLATAKAKLFQTEQIWNRAKTMGPSDALSQNDYDMYQADYETAKANVAVADAEIAQAKSSISQSQASLLKALRNLDFCTIKSPVQGVIIDRRVNVGQTVVSSLNAPSLFLIAKDLTKMQIWVAVNEADIGKIIPGAPVTFTCDTFPGTEFDATVGKVRLNATMTQNVVMYTVEVNTENPRNRLLPYLTANVHFVVQQSHDVLMVPNSALRWYPTDLSAVTPEMRSFKVSADQAVPTTGRSTSGPTTARSGAGGGRGNRTARERNGVVWVKDGDFVRPIEVKVGITDGANTAVTADKLFEGQEVVLGELSDAPVVAAPNTNPFMPPTINRGGGGGRRGG